MSKLLVLLLTLILLAKTLEASPRLQFQEHSDSARFSACYSQTLLHIVHISNNSNKTEEIHISVEGIDISYGIKGEYKLDNGLYGVPAHQTVTVQLPLAFPPDLNAQTYLYLLESVDGSDSLMLTVQALPDSIEINIPSNFDLVAATDSTFRTITFRNYGVIPYYYRDLYYGGFIFPDQFLADTLQPGETQSINALIDNRTLGPHSAFITANYCTQLDSAIPYRVYDPKAYFVQDKIIDSSFGCLMQPPKPYRVVFKNDLQQPTTISALSLYSSNQGWELADSNWVNASISNGDSVVINVIRTKGVTTGELVITTDEAVTVEATLTSNGTYSQPRFYHDIDLLRLKGSGDDHFFDQWQLIAEGTLPSIITSISISDSVHWQVSGQHVGDTIGFKQLVLGETRFKGATTPGDYPVALTITTTPCDTVLKRLVVMTVVASDVEREIDPRPLRVHPSPASDVLSVDVAEPARICLLDMLGNTVIAQREVSGSTDLDVQALASGRYILVVEYGTRKESRMITIRR